MAKIVTIIRKEWAEVFRNRIVLFTVTLLPLIITGIPLVTLIAAGTADNLEAQLSQSGAETFFATQCGDLNRLDCVYTYTLSIFLLLFLVLPIAIPITIAAYSIVGEKSSRSLEPLLATPITTVELLSGKAVAAALPAVLATWVAFALFLFGLSQLVSEAVMARVIQPQWLVAVFGLGPLLTLMAVAVAMMVSSRATDPRVAEQIATVVILPIILLVVGQAAGLILINLTFVFVAVAIVALLDIFLMALAVRLFQRESILTRWR